MNSGSWWWTGRPGVLKSTGLWRVGHDWAAELSREVDIKTLSGLQCSFSVTFWEAFLESSLPVTRCGCFLWAAWLGVGGHVLWIYSYPVPSEYTLVCKLVVGTHTWARHGGPVFFRCRKCKDGTIPESSSRAQPLSSDPLWPLNEMTCRWTFLNFIMCYEKKRK